MAGRYLRGNCHSIGIPTLLQIPSPSPPPVLTANGGHQKRYGWQAGHWNALLLEQGFAGGANK